MINQVKETASNIYNEFQGFSKLKKFGFFCSIGAIVLSTYNITTGNDKDDVNVIKNKVEVTQEYKVAGGAEVQLNDNASYNAETNELKVSKLESISAISKIRESSSNKNTNDTTSSMNLKI